MHLKRGRKGNFQFFSLCRELVSFFPCFAKVGDESQESRRNPFILTVTRRKAIAIFTVSWFLKFLLQDSVLLKEKDICLKLFFPALSLGVSISRPPKTFCKSCSIWWMRTQKLWVSRTTAIKFIISIFLS